jgi:hypothetical protein
MRGLTDARHATWGVSSSPERQATSGVQKTGLETTGGVLMLGRDSGKHARWNAAALAATLALTSAVSSASPPQTSAAETSGASESATWVPKVLSFTYYGVTTHYTCDALQTRMKALLLELGARPDLRVVTWGCTRQIAADILPGVTVQMNVLQPAASGATPLAAH